MRHENFNHPDRELQADSLHALDNPVQNLAFKRPEDQRFEGHCENRLAPIVNNTVLYRLDLEYGYNVAVLYSAGSQQSVKSF